MDKVYMVQFDWSTDDSSDVEVELFDSYEKAHSRYLEIINAEKHSDSWVAEAFDEEGNIKYGYDFEESDESNPYDCWWNINNKYDWYQHIYLDMKSIEVK